MNADPAPTAVVDGLSYGVAIVRGIELEEGDLTSFGRLEQATDGSIFFDDQAFEVRNVEPRSFLVVRAKPGLRDDAGTWGDFIGLLGEGQDPDLCAYFVRLGPSWCEDGGS